jgi:hypothetical protein
MSPGEIAINLISFILMVGNDSECNYDFGWVSNHRSFHLEKQHLRLFAKAVLNPFFFL